MSSTFLPLLHGKENAASAQKRHDIFEGLWSHQEQRINEVVNHVDSVGLTDIVHFVKQAAPSESFPRIPTGLVLTGPNFSIQERLLEHWKSNQTTRSAEDVIILDPSHAPNLTTALKNVIRSVIVQRNGLEWYQSFLHDHRRLIPMNYDLELLETFVEREKIHKIVISILDVEVFDVSVLAELISALSSWIDRLPIVLLFGIATTIELFEARLPKAIHRLLKGRTFDISPRGDSLYQVYQTVQDHPDAKLYLGPTLSRTLLGRAKDQDELPDSFANSIRYLYMSQCFSNPLSVLLGDAQTNGSLFTSDLCSAIRTTDSFRHHVEKLLESKAGKAVTQLLNDDEYLMGKSITAVAEGQLLMVACRKAVQKFVSLHGALPTSTNTSLSSFEVDTRAYSGPEFFESGLYIDTISTIQKLPSDKLEELLTKWSLPEHDTNPAEPAALADIQSLHKASSGNPVRSVHDPNHSTATTTISRNNTVALSKHAPKLSKLEKEYTAMVDRVWTTLTNYFEANIIDIKTLFMHEVFVYDLKIPLAGAFAPRPRYAIERALGHPGDYLGCECCSVDPQGRAEGMRSGMLPPTSLLWQLWCEAGNIVNVRDLWEAFSAAIVDRQDDDEREETGEGEVQADKDIGGNGINERTALTLFYRGLAELRMLGFVKPTKKKVDCLAKVTWGGL